MNPKPEGTPSAARALGLATWIKLKWLWQHPWKATLGAIVITCVFAPVWTQLVVSSDAYKALEARKPVDGMLAGLGWLLSGTVPTPVPVMVALVALLGVFLVAYLRARKASQAQPNVKNRLMIEKTTLALAGAVDQLKAERDAYLKTGVEMTEKLQAEIKFLKVELARWVPGITDDEKKIVELVAQQPSKLGTNGLKETLKVHPERMKYYIHRLTAEFQLLAYMAEPYYSHKLTDKGRAYAVSAGYI